VLKNRRGFKWVFSPGFRRVDRMEFSRLREEECSLGEVITLPQLWRRFNNRFNRTNNWSSGEGEKNAGRLIQPPKIRLLDGPENSVWSCVTKKNG